jgi:hypothetical protein
VPITVLFPIKKILNIDKYFVYESRDMSDESGTYIILLKLQTILFTLFIGPNTHTLKCRNEDYQYYSNRTQCGLIYGHNVQLPDGPTSK